MGLEVATFVGGLTASWPTSGETKSQGDDHLRLIKSTLQNTFPGANKAFYFPAAEVIAGIQTLDATDMNNTQLVDTSGGNVAVTLPAGLVAADKGWKIDIVKTTTDTNAVIVSPATGTIGSKCGATATIRVGIVCEPATFLWTGAAWICSKPGPMIGSTESFDGATVPPGYLIDDGSSFSNTAFAELFAVLGSSTLRDKRGRVEAGVDSSNANMSTANFGTAPVLGAVKTASDQTLTLLQLPGGITGGGTGTLSSDQFVRAAAVAGSTITDDFSATGGAFVGRAFKNAVGPPTVVSPTVNALTVAVNNTGAAGNGAGAASPHTVVQTTIIVNKIKRAC